MAATAWQVVKQAVAGAAELQPAGSLNWNRSSANGLAEVGIFPLREPSVAED